MTTTMQAENALRTIGMSDLVELSDDLTPLDRWGFTLQYQYLTDDGCEWGADLTRDDGLKVTAENRGDGGCNIYYGDRDARDALTADANTVIQHDWEAEDTFVLLIEALHS